ncbi:MAG: glycosyltransferase [Bacteroidia bacterium]|nr:glycosyltransferase [Bacteroidia bacterium]
MESLLIYFSLLIISIFISIQIFSVVYIFIDRKITSKKFDELPIVSVLLAARNEEKTIKRCLESFSNIDYPFDKIEFLIGNDDSQDNTRDIVIEFIKRKSNFRLLDIKYNIGKSAGKANVLAHLANEAKGEFYFITDCDVAVNKNWIKSILSNFNDNVGIVSGTTTCQTGGFFENLQTMDWLHFMGYIKAFANAGVSCTSVGNNMAVRAEAYRQTGGYEKIEFSITEDYKLFSEVTKRGWDWQNLLNVDSLGLATYISSIKELLHQRKRWLIGGNELPVNWKIMIIIYGLFLPSLIILFVFSPSFAFILWLLKFILQTVFIYSLFKKTKMEFNKGIIFYFIYEIYLYLITFSTIIFYFLPLKSEWKGRKYNRSGLS